MSEGVPERRSHVAPPRSGGRHQDPQEVLSLGAGNRGRGPTAAWLLSRCQARTGTRSATRIQASSPIGPVLTLRSQVVFAARFPAAGAQLYRRGIVRWRRCPAPRNRPKLLAVWSTVRQPLPFHLRMRPTPER